MTIQERVFQVERDGQIIRGIEFRPQGDHLPAAIVSHGFLANDQSTRHYAQRLACMGYAAYCFDFIGGGPQIKSDGLLRHMTVFTEVADLLAVIAHVTDLPYINGADLTLMGCSQGGFVSALTAAQLRQRVSRLILIYPALCIPDDARSGHMMMFHFDPCNVPELLTAGGLELGGAYPRCVMGMNAFTEIAAYRGPVLILHGTEDPVVHVSYARKAQAAYGKRCALSLLPGARHGFTEKEDDFALFAIEQFLHQKTETVTVDVQLTDIEDLPTGERAIAFTGQAESSAFTGQVLPGAVDMQRMTPEGKVSFRAEYTLEGADRAGQPCRIHILNASVGGEKWTPVLHTDSAALAFVNGTCDAYLDMREKGPLVRVFARDPQLWD